MGTSTRSILVATAVATAIVASAACGGAGARAPAAIGDEPESASIGLGTASRDGVEKASVARRSVSTRSSHGIDGLSLASVAVPWRTIPFTIRTLSVKERYELKDGRVTTAWPPSRIHDRYGVPMRIINGYRRYHPLGLARLGLKYLSRYRGTGDPLFLDRARRIGAGMERIAVRTSNAIWFPYRFRFAGNRPPWYSGYAQGFALSFFVRLWEVTTTKRYRDLADLTYHSIRTLRRPSAPWVTWVDGRHHLWIDEYPQELDRTFNGHIFALIGLHDYFELTKRRDLYSATSHERVLALLRGGITTIRAYASTFRNPGAVSDYCLSHHVRNRAYHPVHIVQLRYLTVMTGDDWFDRMADHFAADVA